VNSTTTTNSEYNTSMASTKEGEYDIETGVVGSNENDDDDNHNDFTIALDSGGLDRGSIHSIHNARFYEKYNLPHSSRTLLPNQSKSQSSIGSLKEESERKRNKARTLSKKKSSHSKKYSSSGNNSNKDQDKKKKGSGDVAVASTAALKAFGTEDTHQSSPVKSYDEMIVEASPPTKKDKHTDREVSFAGDDDDDPPTKKKDRHIDREVSFTGGHDDADDADADAFVKLGTRYGRVSCNFDETLSKSSNNLIMARQMGSYKDKETYDMKEDIYAFIVAAPFLSTPFFFACYVIATKYIVYGTLLSGISFTVFDGTNFNKYSVMVKFFLIPVAVSMQGDLMAVYEKLANILYDPKALEINQYATRAKFHLAYGMRFVDGLLSLSVNFLTMLKTGDVLSVFLNFAALHFLQDIDDVFYTLVVKGFFGDKIEHMSLVCKTITWRRRHGEDNKTIFGTNLKITHLDSILYVLTLLVCLAFYIYVTVAHKMRIPIFPNLSKHSDSMES